MTLIMGRTEMVKHDSYCETEGVMCKTQINLFLTTKTDVITY